MELEIAGRTYARTSGVKEHMSGLDGDSVVDDAPDVAELGHRPSDDRLASRSNTARREVSLAIEIFGMSAGVLVMDGNQFVFRATHRAFWELDEMRFGSAAHAEKAAQSSWTRFRHRSPPDSGPRR